jgi:hypothetical protein
MQMFISVCPVVSQCQQNDEPLLTQAPRARSFFTARSSQLRASADIARNLFMLLQLDLWGIYSHLLSILYEKTHTNCEFIYASTVGSLRDYSHLYPSSMRKYIQIVRQVSPCPIGRFLQGRWSWVYNIWPFKKALYQTFIQNKIDISLTEVGFYTS